MAEANNNPQDQNQSQENAPVASDGTFTHGKKKYKILLQKMNIPGVGVVTATDVASDKTLQKTLVELNCIGTAIDLVVE